MPREPVSSQDSVAIAKRHFEQGHSQVKIGIDMGKSPQTISRIIKTRKGKDWDLIVEPHDSGPAAILEQVSELSSSLLLDEAFRFRDVIVVATVGVDAAYNEDYLSGDTNLRDKAYEASDELHRQLGTVCGPLILDKFLHPDFAVGTSGGRGPFYSVEYLGKWLQTNVRKTPSGVSIFSLAGGGMVNPWAKNRAERLDADEVAFKLATSIREADVEYLFSPVAVDPTNEADSPSQHFRALTDWIKSHARLDVCILGVGILNKPHSLFRLDGVLRSHIDKEIAYIKDKQNPEGKTQAEVDKWNYSFADLSHVIFWIGEGKPDTESQKMIDTLNERLVAVNRDVFLSARTIVLVAGGYQKLPAIRQLAYNDKLDAPIRPEVTTLITDANTANELIKSSPNYKGK